MIAQRMYVRFGMIVLFGWMVVSLPASVAQQPDSSKVKSELLAEIRKLEAALKDLRGRVDAIEDQSSDVHPPLQHHPTPTPDRARVPHPKPDHDNAAHGDAHAHEKPIPHSGNRLATMGHHRIPDFEQIADLVIEEGQTVELSGEHHTIAVKGKATVTGELRCVTLMVYPGGSLHLDGARIVIRDVPIDFEKDPEQMGNGLIILGSITCEEDYKVPYSRVVSELQAGQQTIELQSEPQGWQVGDVVGIPDTRTFRWKAPATLPTKDTGDGAEEIDLIRGLRTDEERTIRSIDGKVVTLDRPLNHFHPGAFDRHGVQQGFPYVCNLTRDSVIESENPAGTRGHVIISERAWCSVRGLEVRNMGRTQESKARNESLAPHLLAGIDNTTFDEQGNVTHIGTNQIARYAFHFHHCFGPEDDRPYQFLVENCVVRNFTKWGYIVHGTSYGRVIDNVAWNGQEAGFVTEDGPEVENVFKGNFAAANMLFGIWLNGPHNHLVDNVVGSVTAHGFWMTGNGIHRFPTAPGQSMHDEGRLLFMPRYATTITNEGNEAFSCALNGHLFGGTGTPVSNRYEIDEQAIPRFSGRNFAKNTLCWNCQKATIMYQTFSVDYDGLRCYGNATGLTYAGATETMLRNVVIHNSTTGVHLRGRQASSRFLMDGGEIHVEEGHRNRLIGLDYFSQNIAYDGLIHWFRDVHLVPVRTSTAVVLSGRVTNENQPVSLFINDHQVFSVKQAPDYVLQESDKLGDKVVGMTNSQALNQLGVCWAGEVATCSEPNLPGGVTTNGFVCPADVAEIEQRWTFQSIHNRTSERFAIAE